MRNNNKEFNCKCCGKSTLTNRDYYMLEDKLWLELNNGKYEGMMCMDCVESKLGRKIAIKDLAPVPLNMINEDTRLVFIKHSYVRSIISEKILISPKMFTI